MKRHRARQRRKAQRHPFITASNKGVTENPKYQNALKDFERVFYSSQLRLRKPDARAFEKITSETGIAKEHFVFVDDLPINVSGGEQFGFLSILFSEPKTSAEKKSIPVALGIFGTLCADGLPSQAGQR